MEIALIQKKVAEFPFGIHNEIKATLLSVHVASCNITNGTFKSPG